jgi:hypothetical protein
MPRVPKGDEDEARLRDVVVVKQQQPVAKGGRR